MAVAARAGRDLDVGKAGSEGGLARCAEESQRARLEPLEGGVVDDVDDDAGEKLDLSHAPP